MAKGVGHTNNLLSPFGAMTTKLMFFFLAMITHQIPHGQNIWHSPQKVG